MACAGIDFGSKTSTVAIARRGGIDICANEVSNRATPSVISFQGSERHIGESAASIAAQNHRNTASSIQRLLGLPRACKFAEEESARVTGPVIPHPTTAACATAVFYSGLEGVDTADAKKDDDGRVTFSYEALAAMLFSNLMGTASAEYKAPVKDLVVSVPAYYTHAQRKALLNAAAISNINVLRIVNEHAAIALSYGIFRTAELPEETPIKVAFVDIGESSTTVSISSFNKSRCDVISVASDPSLGGRNLDDILVDKFAAHFKSTYSIDVKSKPKAVARLRKDCEKLKKVLSTVPEALLNIECLMDDVDVKGHVTREEFEQIAAPLLERVRAVCERAVAGAELEAGETLTAVEIVGGSTRVPSFRTAVTDVFTKLKAPVRTTLNADECIARGCALMSAMLSPAFKVRDYAVNDVTSYAFAVDKVFTDGTPVESLTLVPKGNAVPCTKVMKFKSPGVLTVNVKYADAGQLPDVGDGARVCGYVVDAPVDAEAKVNAKVRMTSHGTVEMAGAQLVKEVEVEEEVVVKKEAATEANGGEGAKVDEVMADAEATANGAGAEGSKAEAGADGAAEGTGGKTKEEGKEGGKGGEGKAAAAAAETVTEKRVVKKKKTTDLVVTPLPESEFGMTGPMVTAATELEAKMKANDLYIKERSEAMNSLEAYVYDLRSRIDDYGDLKEYGPANVRRTLKKELDDTEEWIYSEEAEAAEKSAFTLRREGLVKKAWPMVQRKKETEERPVRISVLEAAIDDYKQFALGGAEEYAHIGEEEKQKVVKCCEEAYMWLKTERGKQDGLSKEVDVALTCEELKKKLKEVEGVCEPVKKTPKPKPKEEEKKDAEGKEGQGDGKERGVGGAEAEGMETDGDGKAGKGGKEAGDGGANGTGGDKMEVDEGGAGK